MGHLQDYKLQHVHFIYVDKHQNQKLVAFVVAQQSMVVHHVAIRSLSLHSDYGACTSEIAHQHNIVAGRVKQMQLMGGKEHQNCYSSFAAQRFLKISPSLLETHNLVLGVQHQTFA